MSDILSLAERFEKASSEQVSNLSKALQNDLKQVEEALRQESISSAKRIASAMRQTESQLQEQLESMSQSRLAAVSRSMTWVAIASLAITAVAVVVWLLMLPSVWGDLKTTRALSQLNHTTGTTEQGEQYILLTQPNQYEIVRQSDGTTAIFIGER